MSLLKQTFSEFSNDDCPRLAAALAYYTVFALPPMLVMILMIAGLFVTPDQVMEWFSTQLSEQATEQLQTMVESASRQVTGGISIALVLSILGLIFSASGAFSQFQRALNSAWEVEPDPEQKGSRKVIYFLTKRLLSLGMIVVVAFLLVVALVVSGLISTFTQSIATFLSTYGLTESGSTVLVWTVDAVFSIALLWLLFSMIFKILPDAHVKWKDVRVGALVTAVLFVIGKLVLGWYIGRSSPGNPFGAAGALAVILLFVYYASMIVLLGAEFTQVWATQHDRSVQPSKYAVKVVSHKEHVREEDEGTADKGRGRERNVGDGRRGTVDRGRVTDDDADSAHV